MVLGYDYPILGFFFSVLMIALFVIWLWLLFSVLIDVFRSEDLSGWLKALWVIFVVLIPFLGILVYLIVRGHGMAERAAKALLDSGAIDQSEFDRLKGAALGS